MQYQNDYNRLYLQDEEDEDDLDGDVKMDEEDAEEMSPEKKGELEQT